MRKSKKAKDLFELIKTLTSSEKRYFKLCSKLQAGDNSYMFVFDTLNKQEVYDEKNLIKKLIKAGYLNDNDHPDIFSGKLRAYKSYTRTLIMRSLRLMHEKQGTETQNMKNYLENADIFLAKGLLKDALHELINAKAIAQTYNHTLDLIRIVKKELELEQHYGKKDSIEKIRILHSSIEEFEESIKVQNLYSLLYSEVVIHYRNFGRHKSKDGDVRVLSDKLNVSLFNEAFAKKTFQTHYAFYLIYGYFHLIKNDIPEAKIHFKKVLDLWNEQQHFIEELPKTYVGLISNYLNVCSISNEKDTQFLDYLNIIKNQKHQNIQQRTEQLQEVLFLKLRYTMNFALFNETEKVVKEITKHGEKLMQKISLSRRIAFYYNIIIFHFLKEDFKATNASILAWNFFMEKSEQREDLKAHIKLLELIIEYENSQKSDIFKRVRSISSHLKYKEMYDKLATIVLKNMVLIETARGRDKVGKMTYFLQDLAELKEDIGKENTGGLGIYELELWLESRKRNIENQHKFRFQPVKMFEVYQEQKIAKTNKQASYQ